MLASYLYAAKKVALLKSTWIVAVVFCGLSLGVSGILPFEVSLFGERDALLPSAVRFDAVLVVCYTASTGTLMLMAVAVFAGFRGATMYRDEVEDGSFLVMLSKPIGRQRLILGKWLAFMTALVCYSIALSFSHNLGIAVGSDFGVDAHILGIGFIAEIGVGLIFAVMFAALSLLLSFFLNAVQTALVTAAVGLVAGMTSIIQPLSADPARVQPAALGNPDRSDTTIAFGNSQTLLPEYRNQKGVIYGLEGGEALQWFGGLAVWAYRLPGHSETRVGRFNAVVDMLVAKGVADGRPDFERLANLVYDGGLVDQRALLSEFAGDADMLNLVAFANGPADFDTGREELYKKVLWLDFGHQVSTLTSFPLTSILGSGYVNALSSFNRGALGNSRKEGYSAGEMDAAFLKGFASAFYGLAADAALLKNTPDRTYLSVEEKGARVGAALAELAFIRGASATSFSVIRYRDYMDVDALTAAYVLMAAGLVPLSLLVLRRRDFG